MDGSYAGLMKDDGWITVGTVTATAAKGMPFYWGEQRVIQIKMLDYGNDWLIEKEELERVLNQMGYSKDKNK
jgi:hypothetical protein